LFISLFLCITGMISFAWGLLFEEDVLSIILIIIGILLFILGTLGMYGSQINKKASLPNASANVSSKRSTPKEATSTIWLYAVGAIALGFWVFHSYSVNSPAITLAIIIFVLWVIFGVTQVFAEKKQRLFMLSPEKSETAKVVSKVLKVSGSYVETTYFVSFELSDGTRKNFPVNVNQYNSVKENEMGTLIYKEPKNDLLFIDFKPNV